MSRIPRCEPLMLRSSGSKVGSEGGGGGGVVGTAMGRRPAGTAAAAGAGGAAVEYRTHAARVLIDDNAKNGRARRNANGRIVVGGVRGVVH